MALINDVSMRLQLLYDVGECCRRHRLVADHEALTGRPATYGERLASERAADCFGKIVLRVRRKHVQHVALGKCPERHAGRDQRGLLAKRYSVFDRRSGHLTSDFQLFVGGIDEHGVTEAARRVFVAKAVPHLHFLAMTRRAAPNER